MLGTLRLEGLFPLLLSVALTLPLLPVSRADFPGACDSQPDACSCLYTDTVTQKKMKYDLSSISLDDGSFRYPEIRGADQNLYWYNPCHDAQLAGSFGCEGVIGCQLWQDVFSGLGTLATNRFTAEGSGGKVMLVAQSVDSIATRIMRVGLVCRNDIPNTVVTAQGDHISQYVYEFEMVGPAACALEVDGNIPDNGPQVTISITVGSIMCIAVFVALVVYIIAGVLIQHFNFGKTGKEVVPNYTFWTGLPSLVKDGAMFLVGGIKGLRGDSPPEYEKL